MLEINARQCAFSFVVFTSILINFSANSTTIGQIISAELTTTGSTVSAESTTTAASSSFPQTTQIESIAAVNNKSDRKRCHFSIDLKKAAEIRLQFKNYITKQRPGVFYLNFQYQHHRSENVTFNTRHESGIFQWSLVDDRRLFLLTYPVDLHVVTFETIREGSDDVYANISLKNSDACFMYYSYAVNDIKNLINNLIVRNSSQIDTIRMCHRHFKNQDVKILWYQFTRIWDGYLYECYNATCSGNKCAYIVHMSPITNVVYILCCLSFLFYPLIFALVKRDKMTDPKWMNRYQRNKDTPFGFHRLKMRYFFVSPIKDLDTVSKTYIPECRLILLILIVLLTAYISKPILTYQYFGQKISQYPDIYIPNDPFRRLFVKFLTLLNIELFSYSEICVLAIAALVLAIVLYIFHVICVKVCHEEDDFIIVIDPANPFWRTANSWRISVSDFAVEGDPKSDGIAEMLLKRMALAFTPKFWQFIISKSFGLGKDICQCCSIKCVNIVLRFLCLWFLFVVMIFNLIFNFVTCFIPIFWLLIGTPIKIYYHRNKNMKRNFSHVVCYMICYMVTFILGFMFLVDLIIGSVSFITKIFTYLIFVAIPSFPTAQLRVVLIIVSSLTYLGRYIRGFLSAYEKLLNIIFEAEDNLLKDHNENEKEDNPEKKITEDSVEYIPLEEFDYVCANTFPVGLELFSLMAKIFVTGLFLFTAITALRNNGNFSRTRRTDFLDILSLIFIVISPTVAEIALVVSLEEKMELRKTEIFDLVGKWNDIRNKSVNKNLFVVNNKTGTARPHIAETRNKQFSQNDTIIQCCGCCKRVSRTNICMRFCYYLLFVFCCCFTCDKDGRCVCWRYMRDSKNTGGKYITKRGSVYGRKVRAIVFEYPCFKLKENNEILKRWECEEGV